MKLKTVVFYVLLMSVSMSAFAYASDPVFPVNVTGTFDFNAGEYTAPAETSFLDIGSGKNVIINIINGDTLTINMPGNGSILDVYGNYSSTSGGGTAEINGNMILNALSVSTRFYYGRVGANHGNSLLTINGDLTFNAENRNATVLPDQWQLNYLVYSEGTARTVLNGNVTLSGKNITETAGVSSEMIGLAAGSDITGLNTDAVIEAGADADSIISITNLLSQAPRNAVVYGIQAYDKSLINLKGKTLIENISAVKTDAADTGDAFASGADAFSGDAVINFLSDLTVRGISATGGTNYAYALSAHEGGTINVNTAQNADTIIELEGDLIAEDDAASINIYLTNADSYLQGNTLEVNTGIINLNLLNGGTWRADDGYSIAALNADNGVINTAWKGTASPLTSPSTVSIGAMTGSNPLFVVRTDFDEMKADLIKISSPVSGNSSLQVFDIGMLAGGNSPQGQQLLVIQSDDTLGSFTVLQTQGTLFNYTPLIRETGTEVYVTGFQKDGPSPTPITVLAVNSMEYTAWRQRSSYKIERIGELRNLPDDKGGVWARGYGGELERGGDRKFNLYFKTLEAGVDKRFDEIPVGTLYGGLSVSYSDDYADYAFGRGDNNTTSLSVYSSWFNQRGHYLDLVAKGGILNNEMKLSSGGSDISGEYTNYAFGLLAEYGYTANLGKRWYVEPHVQAAYGHLSDNEYKTSNNVTVRSDAANSLTGSAGFLAGRNFGTDNRILGVYLSARLKHDFLGSLKTSMKDNDGNTMIVEDTFDDTWFEYGIGASKVFSDRISVYADVKRSEGSVLTVPIEVNAGIRLSFGG